MKGFFKSSSLLLITESKGEAVSMAAGMLAYIKPNSFWEETLSNDVIYRHCTSPGFSGNAPPSSTLSTAPRL